MSAIGLGCLGKSQSYGTPDEESIPTIHRALDVGVTFTEVIELYYEHRIDPNVPVENAVGATSDLVRESKPN